MYMCNRANIVCDTVCMEINTQLHVVSTVLYCTSSETTTDGRYKVRVDSINDTKGLVL